MIWTSNAGARLQCCEPKRSQSKRSPSVSLLTSRSRPSRQLCLRLVRVLDKSNNQQHHGYSDPEHWQHLGVGQDFGTWPLSIPRVLGVPDSTAGVARPVATVAQVIDRAGNVVEPTGVEGERRSDSSANQPTLDGAAHDAQTASSQAISRWLTVDDGSKSKNLWVCTTGWTSQPR